MPLPKSLTTITPFSKLLAMALFIAFPLVGFFLGTLYQEKVELLKKRMQEESLSIPRSPTPSPIKISSRGWKVHEDEALQYSIEFPQEFEIKCNGEACTIAKEFGLGRGPFNSIQILASVADEPIPGYSFSIVEETVLRELEVGQSKVVRNLPSGSGLDNFYRYKRLSDMKIGGMNVRVYENLSPWEYPENTTQFYILFDNGSIFYRIVAYVGEDISKSMLNEILSTFSSLNVQMDTLPGGRSGPTTPPGEPKIFGDPVPSQTYPR